ncbi:hypothetical protein GCM10009830_01580 [Glycomyces endophyticus]|uniref:Uncharacterized protein n=1 Tax=Glycomyces endophyticus TaxID=480996 RepID=A0ABN2FV18_9ACTN
MPPGVGEFAEGVRLAVPHQVQVPGRHVPRSPRPEWPLNSDDLNILNRGRGPRARRPSPPLVSACGRDDPAATGAPVGVPQAGVLRRRITAKPLHMGVERADRG